MAPELVYFLVVNQCHITVPATGDPVTGLTFEPQGKSATVLEEDCLLTVGQCLFQLLQEGA
jgi:hypothetical protein